jgi:hypothetical protein
MSRICRECKKGELKITGTAGFDDMIEVECQNPKCGEIYEVEMDGLGESGEEMIEAVMMEERRKDPELNAYLADMGQKGNRNADTTPAG